MIAKAVSGVANFISDYFFFFLPKGHPWDYVAHFIISFAGVLAILLFLKFLNIPDRLSFYIAIAVMLVLGIIKEIDDIYLGKTDGIADMTANILGIALAVLIIFLSKKMIT